MSSLILIRGISGSGKSTLAKQMKGFKHYEADMFFMIDGKYCYEPTKIKEAHAWCQRKTLQALRSGKDVVVSNTFTRLWEMKPYLQMGYPVQIIEAKGKWKNIHNIPDYVIERMKQRWQEITPEMGHMLISEDSIKIKEKKMKKNVTQKEEIKCTDVNVEFYLAPNDKDYIIEVELTMTAGNRSTNVTAKVADSGDGFVLLEESNDIASALGVTAQNIDDIFNTPEFDRFCTMAIESEYAKAIDNVFERLLDDEDGFYTLDELLDDLPWSGKWRAENMVRCVDLSLM